MPTRAEFNARVIEEFRANGGRLGGDWADTTLILVHHVGARTGAERVTPLVCFPRDDGRTFLVVASNGGSRTHPQWYTNLKVNPRTVAEVGAETFPVLAVEIDETRDSVWPALVEEVPQLAQYEAASGRRIPVLALVRQDARPA